ncbi:uncharacterized protein LOC127281210 [Leptopilina boulardi]|uniref:uncharacterized protein LOC127281210 n=1 Tax=Leptopilina boulardi TaxID=63433 RepID=UPI0021F5D18B|nr:uncharacterized protein LOC127281210 [Leptopilina boulardi]
MLGMNWLKRKLKKNMTPLQRPYAAKMSRRLSFIYAFLGWNFVAVLIYMTFKSHIPEGPGKTQRYLEIMNISKAEVIQLSGLKKISEYQVDRTEEYLKSKEGTGDIEVMID